MNDHERIQQLFRSQHPCITIQTYEEHEALDLVRQALGQLHLGALAWTASQGIFDPLADNARPDKDTANPTAALHHLAYQSLLPEVLIFLDLLPHLSDAKTLRLLRDLVESVRDIGGHLIMIDHGDKLPPVIAHLATRFELSLPTEEEMGKLIRGVLQREHRRRPVKAKLSRSSFKTILRNLGGLTRRQAEQIIIECIADDRRLTDQDVNTVLARKRQMLHQEGLLEYVEAPVSLDEIAGLKHLKTWLRQRQASLSEEAEAFGIEPPRGVLMLGVPGAGKSLCAKAVATAWQRPLLRLDPSVLYDRYVGESERRLRDALRQAEAMSPIILWIDEIEKGFASAASRSVDGGLSQRMFGSLLTWMQEHTKPVFLIATANNIEALPPELLRKGRFDEIFFVDVPTKAVRKAIFSIHLNKRKLDPDEFDLDQLAQASDGYTGSEIEQAVISAMHDAFSRHAKPDTEGVLKALRTSPPLTVTMAEKMTQLRQWARNRCAAAG